jgi:hypothetical protein
MLCRTDLEKWVHGRMVALQCDPDMRSWAEQYDHSLAPSQKFSPSLFNERMPFLPLGLDLMEFYECGALCYPLCFAYPSVQAIGLLKMQNTKALLLSA